MKKNFGLIVLIFVFSTAAQARENASADYLAGIGTKLGRGIENVVTSPAEVPCRIESEMKKGDPMIHFFSGIGEGAVLFVRRVLWGAAEVVTFIVPMEQTLPHVCYEEPVGVIG